MSSTLYFRGENTELKPTLGRGVGETNAVAQGSCWGL